VSGRNKLKPKRKSVYRLIDSLNTFIKTSRKKKVLNIYKQKTEYKMTYNMLLYYQHIPGNAKYSTILIVKKMDLIL